MKFIIHGEIKRSVPRSFKLEVEAKSEKHATELALVKLGSREGARKAQISITKVEKG